MFAQLVLLRFAFQAEPGVVLSIEWLLSQLLALGGVAAVVAALINVLKTFGLVKDGTAPTWTTGFNILALVGLFVLRIFRPDVDISFLDGQAQVVANFLIAAVSLASAFGLTGFVHNRALRGKPVIGKSYSFAAANQPQSARR